MISPCYSEFCQSLHGDMYEASVTTYLVQVIHCLTLLTLPASKVWPPSLRRLAAAVEAHKSPAQ